MMTLKLFPFEKDSDERVSVAVTVIVVEVTVFDSLKSSLVVSTRSRTEIVPFGLYVAS